MKSIAARRIKRHSPAQLFKTFPHGGDSGPRRTGSHLASVVARLNGNRSLLHAKRDPKILRVGMFERVRGDLLDAPQHSLSADVISEMQPAGQRQMQPDSWDVRGKALQRSSKIDRFGAVESRYHGANISQSLPRCG